MNTVFSPPGNSTTLALVEPWHVGNLPDRPHLGCAMLLAACQKRNIPARLITGPTRWLRDLFLSDQEELWHLLHDMPDEVLQASPWLKKYRDDAMAMGTDSFAHKLTGLYERAVCTKDLRTYFDITSFNEVSQTADIATMLYQYYIRVKKHENLNLVQRYVRAIEDSNPTYIGFSIGKELDVVIRTIIKKVRAAIGRPVFLGGSSTPFFDEAMIRNVLQTPLADYLVMGMGEDALPALMECLEAGRTPEALPGIYYSRHGAITGTRPTRQPLLDNLPAPDFSQFALDEYFIPRTVLPIQTSRGCSWRRCSFCAHSKIYENDYTTENIDKMVDMIEDLQARYGCSHFVIHDEELPPARARRISERILERGLDDVFLYGYARTLKAYNDETLLTTMFKAGFRTICWGIESASQKVVDSMQKGTQVADMGGILQKSARIGFANLCFVMFGFPGEEESDAMQTLTFIREHAAEIDALIMCTFKLLHGTPIANDPEKWDISIAEDGTWSAAHGMPPREADAFLSRVEGEINLGLLRLGTLNLKIGNNLRMLHFLRASRTPLTAGQVDAALRNGDVSQLFPLMLGHITGRHRTAHLTLANTTSTSVLNAVRKPVEIPLTDIEVRLFHESAGEKSLEEIITLVSREALHEEAAVRETALKFFKDMIVERQSGLMFGTSWGKGTRGKHGTYA